MEKPCQAPNPLSPCSSQFFHYASPRRVLAHICRRKFEEHWSCLKKKKKNLDNASRGSCLRTWWDRSLNLAVSCHHSTNARVTNLTYTQKHICIYCCCSVTKSVSNLLQAHGLQHTRLPSPSLSPRVCSKSCLLSWWCYLTISSSAAPFSFCPQYFPAWGSFPMSQLITSGGQSIGALPSVWVLPMNNQSWFPLGLTDLISLLTKGHLHWGKDKMRCKWTAIEK